jgi:hypothetical protein
MPNDRTAAAYHHLSVPGMARLSTGRMEADEMARDLVPHLAAQCPECREQLAELERLMREVRHWDALVVVVEGQEAPALWERLAPLPYAEQLRAVETDDILHTWGLCRLLQRLSEQAVPDDPARAARLANLSVRISRHLGDVYGPEWVRDLRALALGRLGDARRRLGEPTSAQDAFDAAETERLAGTGDPSIEAELAALAALLRHDRDRRHPAGAPAGADDAR